MVDGRRVSELTTEDDNPVVRAPRPREPAAAHLFRLIECESPASLPARSCLRGVSTVSIGRGSTRGGELRDGRLSLFAPDRFLSSTHAQLRRTGEGWLLEDTGSKNGTLVFGARVDRSLLQDGDLVEAGHTFFLFRTALSAPADGPAHLEATRLGPAAPGLATLHPALEAAFERLRAVAPSRLPIVIAGETGTGKELAAAAVHALSERSGAFVAVNCAAIPPALLESELFGHKRGAFSGAIDDKPGLVRASDRGTLFLDEIGELPPAAQAALLRVLQQAEVVPVGGTQPIKVDLRLVCATHRDLRAMAASGMFRPDLLARLQGFALELPPLRERREDFGLFVSSLLRRHAKEPDRVTLLPEVARALFAYRWPLNVRELERVLAAALLLAKGGQIGLDHLPREVRAPQAQEPRRVAVESLSDEEKKRRAQLVELLARHDGNVSAVARELGKGRTQVVRWVRRYGIDRRSRR